jgi:hypothetical protein
MSGNERDTDSDSEYDLTKDDDVASMDSEEQERIWEKERAEWEARQKLIEENRKIGEWGRYLNSVFQNATLRLPISVWKTPFPVPIASGGTSSRIGEIEGIFLMNDLFQIDILDPYMRRGEQIGYTIHVIPREGVTPAMTIRPFIGPHNLTFHLEQDGDDLIWETKSMIPLRWLYVIKELYPPANIGVIELKNFPDFTPVIRSLPQFNRDAILEKIGIRDFEKLSRFRVRSAPRKGLWQTMDTGVFVKRKQGWSPEAEAVIDASAEFECIGKEPYFPLPASEGGIYIVNPYSQAWSRFIREVRGLPGSQRLEIKGDGSSAYHPRGDITPEEARIMVMIFRHLGCDICTEYEDDKEYAND